MRRRPAWLQGVPQEKNEFWLGADDNKRHVECVPGIEEITNERDGHTVQKEVR